MTCKIDALLWYRRPLRLILYTAAGMAGFNR
jgi:hypothetical protein